MKKDLIFWAGYALAFAVQTHFLGAVKITGLYYGIAALLLLLTSLTKRIPSVKSFEPGMVFLGLSTLRLFLYLTALLPLLLNYNELGLSKTVTLSTLFPFVLVLFFDAFKALKTLKIKDMH